jgi:hypothetical protein
MAPYIADVPSDRTRSLMYLYSFFSLIFVCNCRWLFSYIADAINGNPIGRHFPLKLVFSSYNFKREI